MVGGAPCPCGWLEAFAAIAGVSLAAGSWAPASEYAQPSSGMTLLAINVGSEVPLMAASTGTVFGDDRCAAATAFLTQLHPSIHQGR